MRSAPPPGTRHSTLPPTLLADDDVPRFSGQSAPLSALAAQVRNAADPEDKASAAGRFARQLFHRGIEIREAIALAEKSLAIKSDPELAYELAKWWITAGDAIRGAALLQSQTEALPVDRRKSALLEIAQVYSRAGQARQAHQAIRQLMELSPHDPKPYELMGSLGFWSDLPSNECARAYLKAAEHRLAAGEDAAAFENRLRAFEVEPALPEAATKLAVALRKRNRSGAADEILREHLRRGSAANRAAHHQRVFYGAFSEGDLARALESAFEAELDIELDPNRLSALLSDEAEAGVDFESFLVYLAKDGELGDPSLFGEWLLALVDIHRKDWGHERTDALIQLITNTCRVSPLSPLADPDDETRPRELRQLLGGQMETTERNRLREEIARRECALGRWDDAFEVFEPLLSEPQLSLSKSVLGIVISGRARRPVARAKALSAFGACLPDAASAVAHAVASEALLAHGLLDEARVAAAAAIEAEPTSERAVASQALVALSAPEAASSALLERSLSVLVARSETCAVLCRSASERGADRLGLTWAARAFALRPGDSTVAGSYLRQAILARDAEQLRVAILEVLAQAAPTSGLSSDLARAVSFLAEYSEQPLIKVTEALLTHLGVREKELTDSLIDAAKKVGAAELLSAITERMLVGAANTERSGLLLLLCRQRLRAGHPVAAARALRRAVAQGADRTLVEECLVDFEGEIEPDGELALMEVRVELLPTATRQDMQEKARALRRVGAARWDMAQDSAGAVQLWQRAADIDPQRGLDLFAHYLHVMAGAETAADQLQFVARQTEDPARSGKLLGLASREQLRLGKKPEAFALVREALHRAPLLAELLAVAESAANEEQLGQLEELYDLIADNCLGRYAQRALHYRAARQLEERGHPDKALVHACAAFEAVPAEGVAFVMMARLADSIAGHGALVSSLERAADGAHDDAERARWLSKAASLADAETMGSRQRAEILLRAAQMTPERSTLESLLDALAHYLADEPSARDEMWARYQVVSQNILRHAAGAYGAQMNVLLGAAGTTHFEQPDFTLDRLSDAIDCDIEIPEYQALSSVCYQLAGLVEKATSVVDKVKSIIDDRAIPLGRGLAELAGRIAQSLGDNETQTELLVRAASDFPEDDELMALARKVAIRDNRQDLLGLIEGFLPVSERAQLVLQRLSALSLEDGLDALLDLDVDSASEPMRAQLLAAMATRQEQTGRLNDAAVSYRELLQLEPDHLEALRGVERDAERRGDFEELSKILQKRIELSVNSGEAHGLQLRRATVLETRLGRPEEARRLLSAMVEEEEDRAALRMLADSWQRSGDPAEAGDLWLRVQRVTGDDDEADDAAYRAATCFVDAGTPFRAVEALSEIKKATMEHRKLGLDVARKLDDPAAILDQLIGLAEVTVGDNQETGRLFLEAARRALRVKDFARAETCARRACEATPQSPEARFVLARLVARRRPPQTREAGQELQQQLAGTEGLGGATEREIHAFLSAQAVRLAESPEAARQLLEKAIEEQGQKPLLALGLAEVLKDDPKQAVTLYEHAVGGDLHGFRGEGEILLEASSLARELGDFDRARGLASAVPDDDPLRAQAARQLEEIALDQARARREAREKELAERAAQEKRKAEEAAEMARVAEEERKLAEETRLRAEAERAAAEEAERKAAEEKAEAEHRAVEERRKAEEAAEVAARAEEERRRAVEEAEAERMAAEEAQRRVAAEREAAEREAVEQAARRAEAEREAAEEKAAEEKAAEEKAAEEKARDAEEQRRVAEEERATAEAHRREQQRQAHQRAAAIREAARDEHRRASQAATDQEEIAPVSHGVPIGSMKQPPLPGLDPVPAPMGRLGNPVVSGGRPRSRPPSRHPVQTERSDEVLVNLLEQGDIDAGLELLERLQQHRSRSRDALVVAQHLAALDPADASLLGRLVATASRDGNDALVFAVRHVLGAYGSGDPVSAPPPSDLLEQGRAVQALLKHAAIPAHEALALVWEHAGGLYRRELGHYGVSGIERVPLHAPTPLAEMYSAAARVLGRERTAVFRSDAGEEISMQIALLSPPAVIVAGEIEEPSPELNFHLGAMLAAASPEHALLFGGTPEEVGSLLEALAVSFGAGREAASARPPPEVMRVASYFWETIPARAQRRLSQLCADPGLLAFDPLAAASRRALRRAGLIVCGDLPTAIDDACIETGLSPPRHLADLADCARRSSAVADLLGLALSPEYAEVRFRTAG